MRLDIRNFENLGKEDKYRDSGGWRMARKVNGGIGIGFEETGYLDEVVGSNGIASFSTPSPSPSRSIAANSSPPSNGAVGSGGLSYIVHHVTKFDTLAGVAIKYGVEVADIRRLNGLVTDSQMFALKTLQIPLPGRHPPSAILSNGFDDGQRPSSSEKKTPCRRRHTDLFDTLQSLKLKSSSQHEGPSSINSLRDYYGLRTVDGKSLSEGFEMTAYQNGGAHRLENGTLAEPSTINPPHGIHHKCKSVANGFISENGDLAWSGSGEDAKGDDSDKWIKRMHVRRRQKSEADFSSYSKEENISGGSRSSAIMVKGLGLRSKLANLFLSGADVDADNPNSIPVGLGDSFIHKVIGFRKSSSTSSLQESDNSTLLSLWSPSKWSLKPDLNALSTTAIARPIFDGIPNPISARKNKAAVD